VKAFVIYSALRLALFAAVLALVIGIWIRVFGGEQSILWPVLVAFLISGLLSLFLLNKPREEFARRVEERAHRAATKFEELKTKED
jgi:MFS family permease